MLLRKELAKLQSENEMLKEQLFPLIEQLNSLSKLIDQDTISKDVYYRLRSATQAGDFLRMYESLPDQFTLNDMIHACEQYDVNVFVAYEHIKVLLHQGQLLEADDLFTKPPPPDAT